MNIRKAILAAALLAGTAMYSSGEEARLLRFPATNGTDIIFSYAGDLYTVPAEGGEAKRLTSHVGYEMFARFSPDGKKVAFTGEYDGNREVYMMDAKGGKPVRLTYTSTNSRDDLGDRMGPNNIVMGWNPDGKSIIYRNRIGDGFDGKLWTVSTSGDMPKQIPLPEGGFCCWSPDGKVLAYNRVMREFRTWKYYRGGMADDIWLYNPKAKKVENITSNIAQDLFPMWIGDEIFFASDRDMIMNIFAYNTKTKKTEKVTNFTDYDVKFPSTDGKSIVFEKGGYIYTLDPKTRKSTQVHITIASDEVYAREESRNVSSNMTSVSISPDGKRAAVTARGEVFDVPVGEGVTKSISRTPGSNDRGADWSPDGKWIAWIGDNTGETELYLYDTEKGGNSVMITKDNDTYIRSMQWSPDSKHILYTDRKNRIVEVDPVAKTSKVLVENPEGEFFNVAYSPDSKWLAYTRPAKNFMSVVYLYNIASGKEYQVTDRWYNSSNPSFSTDGKYLIFNSDRDINPIYSRIEWNFAVTSMNGVYMVMLDKNTPSPLLLTDGTAANDTAKKTGEKKETASKAKEESQDIIIDPEGISERIIKLPIKGYARNFYCDGKKVWYNSVRGSYVLDLATRKVESTSDAGAYFRIGDKKGLAFKGKDVYAVTAAGKLSFSDKVNMSEIVADIDYSAEWPQIFDEVWRAFRDGFYLENMHGRDWNAIKDKYSVFLPHVKTRLDLNYVIGEMISELACGHAYVNVGEYPKAPRVTLGLLGAEVSKDAKSGYFRIDRILKGAPYSETLRSPLTEPGIGVKEGDYITAINGISLKDVPNIYRLLEGKADIMTELTVNTSASEGGKKVIIKPISDEYPLYHYEWVQKNIRTVEEKSGGKVGYIYIPDMGPEGLKEFARYYYPQIDKEALIIDDRANGGGNISPMIIERLQREAYRLTMRRTSSMTGTIPEATLNGPKVLLINKYSASDGDLFPWSFKANNLGKVIGTRSWGGIVGITSSLPYMDGTDVRVPFFTNYDAKTGQWIVENHGVDPDIVIDNDPIDEFSGKDEQLLKAIEVALEEIKNRKPLPGVPAPRTFKDLGLPEHWDGE